MRHLLLHLESDPRSEMTHYGGLVLAQQFVRQFRVAQRLDGALRLFKRHAPYHESDHVLALAYTLYADGTCLEDQAVLQGSEAVGGCWERVGLRTRRRPEIFCVDLRPRKMSSGSRELSTRSRRRCGRSWLARHAVAEKARLCAGRSRRAYQVSLWRTERRRQL